MTTATIERDTTDRKIHLEIAHNVRHLGGHPTANGHETTAFDIIRSGSLHELTEAGQATLRDLGVKVIVDFRSDIEHEKYPTPDLSAYDITIIEAPVFQADYSPGALARQERYPGHAATYQQFLTEGGGAFRALFETIAMASGPGALPLRRGQGPHGRGGGPPAGARGGTRQAHRRRLRALHDRA